MESRCLGLRQQAPGGSSAEPAIDEAAGMSNLRDDAALGVNTKPHQASGEGFNCYQDHRLLEREA